MSFRKHLIFMAPQPLSTSPWFKPLRIWVGGVLALLLFSGCQTPVGVTRVDPESVRHELTRNALSTGTPSHFSDIALHVLDLTETYADEPSAALQKLHQFLLREDQRRTYVAFALAELSFLHAQKTHQTAYYLAAAVYAYLYLFPEDSNQLPDPLDPRVRIAADLFNRSLTSGFIAKDRTRVRLQAGTYPLPFGSLHVDLPDKVLQWENRKLSHFIPVAELKVHGLQNRYRHPGLGIPLAANQTPVGPEEGLHIASGKLPVTAFMRFPHLLEDIRKGAIRGEWEMYNAYDHRTVKIQGRDRPLEIEFSSALAANLADSPVWERELAGFFRGTSLTGPPHPLTAFEPYRPGRIPVVFVHGTASGPGRWADMINDLIVDPSIHSRFQFWTFTYNTGNPPLYSAALLREALQKTVTHLERKYQDPALKNMIIIGHSQGGLLTKLLAVDPGTKLWEAVSPKPFEEMNLSAQTRDLLKRSLFFDSLPFVKRVIFIATPHHGSYVADSWIAHQLAKLVRLPRRMVSGLTNMITLNFEALNPEIRNAQLGSVYAMEPGSPLMDTMAPLPLAPEVSGHSIIAVKDEGPLEEGTDGVVAYTSAHLDGMDSEFIVRSGHSCQSNTHTIQEVRRILLVHARELCQTHKICS